MLTIIANQYTYNIFYTNMQCYVYIKIVNNYNY